MYGVRIAEEEVTIIGIPYRTKYKRRLLNTYPMEHDIRFTSQRNMVRNLTIARLYWKTPDGKKLATLQACVTWTPPWLKLRTHFLNRQNLVFWTKFRRFLMKIKRKKSGRYERNIFVNNLLFWIFELVFGHIKPFIYPKLRHELTFCFHFVFSASNIIRWDAILII